MPASTIAAADRLRHVPTDAIGTVVLALAIRLPAWFASAHLVFDDGVYGSAALSMRSGYIPFRDVYSPQGPAHLATVWLFDTLTGRTSWSPRTASVIAGVVAALAARALVLRLAGPRNATLAGVLVAATASIAWVTVPITGDGIALAWALVAMALAARWSVERRATGAALFGVAAALALATKVLVGPFLIVPLAIVVQSRPTSEQWRRALIAAVTATGAVMAGLVIGFGPSRVWQQSVAYHLSTKRVTTISHNISTVFETLLRRDLVICALGVVGLAQFVRRRRRGASDPTALVVVALAVWLLVSTAAMITAKGTFRAHVSGLAVPIALIAAITVRIPTPPGSSQSLRSPRRWLVWTAAGLAAVVAAVQLATLVAPREYTANEQSAVNAFRSVPMNAWVITDEPGLAWRAGREVPPWQDDTGIKRFDGNDLRDDQRGVLAAVRSGTVCAAAIWTFRYATLLPGLTATLADNGFRLVAEPGRWRAPDGTSGRRQIWTRADCQPAP